MFRIETIKEFEVPTAPKIMSKVSADILAAINALKKDEVVRPQLDPDKKIRGLKSSV